LTDQVIRMKTFNIGEVEVARHGASRPPIKISEPGAQHGQSLLEET
jgi:hypothetical protein